MSKVKQDLWHEPEHDYELQTVKNMNVSEISNFKFLKKDDVMPDVLLTIKCVEKVNVAKDNEKPEFKAAIYFNEVEKPMVLNQTNGNRAAVFLGSTETNDWLGKKVVVFYDPLVEYSGKITGGIRLRAPKNQDAAPTQAAAAQKAPAPAGIEPDDIPF